MLFRSQGKLTREALGDALAKQSSELVYELLRWGYGRFTFSREPFRPEADAARLGLGVSGMVLEGFRRVDEWRLMESTVDFDQVLEVDTAGVLAVGDEKLSPAERRLLAALDGTRSVAEAIKESAMGSFDGVKSVYQLLQSRLLRPRA